MNILALTSAYPQPDDGNEVVTPTVKYFCEKWVEDGHRVVVIHNNSCFPKAFYMIPDGARKKLSSKLGHDLPTAASRKQLNRIEKGVHVFRLPMVKTIPHSQFSQRKIDKQIDKIERILEKEKFKPDVIISHWVNPQIELIIPLGKVYGAKTSLVFHDDCSERNVERFNLKEKIRELTAVGCRSQSYAEHVRDVLDLERTPFVCYSGIPDDLADARQKEFDVEKLNNVPEYIYVGRLVKYKNVDVIIEALHQFYGDRLFKLHIVGVGAEEAALKQKVSEYGLEDRVVFYGQLKRNDVFELMKKCMCFIMVSQHETFGMVYIEAMLAGCITIASIGGGVDGIIQDGENGFLSEEGSVRQLISKLQVIDEMGTSSRSIIRKNAFSTAYHFKDSIVAKKYLEEIKRL